jgi:hypothetical protein
MKRGQIKIGTHKKDLQTKRKCNGDKEDLISRVSDDYNDLGMR